MEQAKAGPRVASLRSSGATHAPIGQTACLSPRRGTASLQQEHTGLALCPNVVLFVFNGGNAKWASLDMCFWMLVEMFLIE